MLRTHIVADSGHQSAWVFATPTQVNIAVACGQFIGLLSEQARSWDQGQVGADENDVDGKLLDGAGQVGVQIQVGHHSGDIV